MKRLKTYEELNLRNLFGGKKNQIGREPIFKDTKISEVPKKVEKEDPLVLLDNFYNSYIDKLNTSIINKLKSSGCSGFKGDITYGSKLEFKIDTKNLQLHGTPSAASGSIFQDNKYRVSGSDIIIIELKFIMNIDLIDFPEMSKVSYDILSYKGYKIHATYVSKGDIDTGGAGAEQNPFLYISSNVKIVVELEDTDVSEIPKKGFGSIEANVDKSVDMRFTINTLNVEVGEVLKRDAAKKEFDDEFKETCEEIEEMLYDIRDLADSYDFKIIKNTFYCSFKFEAGTGFIDGKFKIKTGNSLIEIFETIKEIRSRLTTSDIDMDVEFQNTIINIIFTKDSDFYKINNQKSVRPRARFH